MAEPTRRTSALDRSTALLSLTLLVVVGCASSAPTGIAPEGSPRGSVEKAHPATRLSSTPQRTTAPDSPPPDGSPPATILVAGDIASCGWHADGATARLIEGIPGTVMTAGDNAYQTGTRSQFRRCYDPTWGRFRGRTRPVTGNHDWYTSGASGYFEYFGDRAGPAGKGYYAFDAGTWRVYGLVSDCDAVGGCDSESRQRRWLESDLEEHPRRCVLAVWHRPRWSSGPHGSSRGAASPMLRALYREGADVVVNGHDHIYERFGLAEPDGTPDAAHGVRQFIVGTGGAPHYGIQRPYAPNSRVRDNTSHGVLRLTLEDGAYSWEFVPVAGDVFTDSGDGACHGPPPGSDPALMDPLRW